MTLGSCRSPLVAGRAGGGGSCWSAASSRSRVQDAVCRSAVSAERAGTETNSATAPEAFTGCRSLRADSFCKSVMARTLIRTTSLRGRQRRDRLAVLRGGRSGLEVAEHGSAFQAVGHRLVQIRSIQRFPFSDWVPSWIFRSSTGPRSERSAALLVGVKPWMAMKVQSAGQSFRRLFANRR